MVVIGLAVVAGVAVAALVMALWPPRRVSAVGASSASGRAGGFGRDPGRLTGAQSFQQRTRNSPAQSTGSVLLERVAQSPVVAWAASRGVTVRAQATDLAVTGRDVDAVLAAKIVGATAAGLTSLVIGVSLIRILGPGLSVLLVLAVSAVATVGVYLLPDALVRRQARRRREEFARALPVWCDLVTLEMAGAAAPQEALVTAAEAGTTWPMLVLRDTLHRAVRARQGHWQALTDLGDRIGVTDLAELGRLSQLVSHEGAQVRDTLIERAASIRRRGLAQALGQAGQRDESMRLAVLVIAAGVILLLIYPGTMAVMSL